MDSSDSSNNEVETNNNAGRAADLSEVLAYFLSRGENGLVSEAERLREAQEARRERILQELRDLTPVESEGGATRGGPLQRGPFRSRQVEAMRPKRRGSCMFHAGLAHNCDYRDVVGAVNEVSHWGSDISPGKRRRRRKRALEEPIYNENGIDLLEEAEENEH